VIAVVVAAVWAVGVWAEVPKPVAAPTVNVVMLSDIHFDPFHDPAKLAELRAKPVAEWAAELSAADSATMVADEAALQKACPVRGIDTPWVLLQNSLKAAHAQEPKPDFVTVSGDLQSHSFDCRLHNLAPGITDAQYSEFAAKTVDFVALQLRQTWPGVPVFLTLGNNDSGCTDYKEDAGSAYLQATGKVFAEAVNKANHDAVLKDFSREGDYSAVLPAPFKHTRLLAMQDVFEAKKYTACKGEAAPDAEKEQIAWLLAQLTAARQAHEQVWVLAHMPPGVDAFAVYSKGRNVCGGEKVDMFLDSTAMADVIEEFPDVIKLVVLAHTHMDEMRLMHGVPVKLVPSISPVDGNNPAFTVAMVDAPTATIKDYSVYAASNQTGVGTVWSKEYTYSTAYAEPDFSGESVKKLIAEFAADKAGKSDVSKAYEGSFFVGDPGVSANAKATAMQMVWPGYVCSMTEMNEAGFKACVCPAKP